MIALKLRNFALLAMKAAAATLIGLLCGSIGGFVGQAVGISVLFFALGATHRKQWMPIAVIGLAIIGGLVLPGSLGHVYPLMAIAPLTTAIGAFTGAKLADMHRGKRWLSQGLTCAVVAAGSAIVMLNWLSFFFAPSVTRGPAPDFAFRAESGQVIRKADLRGQVVVLDFWSTSCAVCYEKFPALQRLRDRFRGERNVRVIAVHLRETPERSTYPARFFAGSSFDFERVWTEDSASVVRAFDIQGLPTVIVIAPNGDLVFKGSGMVEAPSCS